MSAPHLMPRIVTPQNLLIDADDTLWENNIYFEQAIARFLDHLDHQKHTREEVRECLNACEARNILAIGYGLRSFEQSLVDCFREMSSSPVSEADQKKIAEFSHAIAVQEIEVLHGVEATLDAIGSRHKLILVTKGHPLEQTDKLRRSRLQHHFRSVEVVPEKDADAYHLIVDKHSLDPQNSWMVGNSPKSDVNPALAAGLNAIFVPHAQTWVLENTELDVAEPPQRLLHLERFADLADIF